MTCTIVKQRKWTENCQQIPNSKHNSKTRTSMLNKILSPSLLSGTRWLYDPVIVWFMWPTLPRLSSCLFYFCPKGVGKTTLVQKACERLKASGIQTKGFYTEELRTGGRRQGFDVVTLHGERGPLARVGYTAALFRKPPFQSSCVTSHQRDFWTILSKAKISFVVITLKVTTEMQIFWK